MSGGSYEYLCWKDGAELFESTYQLREMAIDLKADWPGSKAAKDTDELLRLIGHYQREVERRKAALEDVWHAQEWWRSCDYGRDQAEAAVERYEHP